MLATDRNQRQRQERGESSRLHRFLAFFPFHRNAAVSRPPTLLPSLFTKKKHSHSPSRASSGPPSPPSRGKTSRATTSEWFVSSPFIFGAKKGGRKSKSKRGRGRRRRPQKPHLSFPPLSRLLALSPLPQTLYLPFSSNTLSPPRSDDALFYDAPRFVTHIDDAAIAALTEFYSKTFPASGGTPGAACLDLCSSWISHYPKGYKAERVVGLGMNAEELRKNAQLTESVVQDLNKDPKLPFEVKMGF